MMPGTLTLVGTPIGNLGDFSPRARRALEEADFIAAEDTRVTLRLLNYFGIKKPLVSYFEHNKYQSGDKILQRILAGENCALVTDAGMPAVSDPGEELVALCAREGVAVSAVPGPSAVVTAVALSALPAGRFTFEGFLSTSGRSRAEHLEELKGERRTMVFYEAPHKIAKTLADLAAALGAGREVSLCRELTKMHEEVIRTTLGEGRGALRRRAAARRVRAGGGRRAGAGTAADGRAGGPRARAPLPRRGPLAQGRGQKSRRRERLFPQRAVFRRAEGGVTRTAFGCGCAARRSTFSKPGPPLPRRGGGRAPKVCASYQRDPTPGAGTGWIPFLLSKPGPRGFGFVFAGLQAGACAPASLYAVDFPILVF